MSDSPHRQSGTLFGQIARYGMSGVNPRENRLTEIFAAVLRNPHCAGLAEYVVFGWLAHASVNTEAVTARQAKMTGFEEPYSVQIQTQRTLYTETGRRRPDLIIELRRPQSVSADLTLWVEVKHGSEPERDQLEAYSFEQQRQRLQKSAVLLLAPRQGYLEFDEGQIPPNVLQVTWEDTAELVREWTPPDACVVGLFLREELIGYLREEGLVDPDHVTAEDIIALEHAMEATRALHRVCAIAAGQVDRLWGRGRAGRHPQRRPKEYYWYHDSIASDGTAIVVSDAVTPSWRLLMDGTYLLPDARPGVPVFMAGLDAGGPFIAGLRESAIAELQSNQFRIMQVGETVFRKNEYVARTQELHEILVVGDARANAARLAKWVDRTFRDIAAASRSA